MTELTDVQAAEIIKTGKIPREIVDSAKKVAVVVTQDWCPQWLAMKLWLGTTDKKEVKTYFLCYNRKNYFHSFMMMKEKIWNNDLVPYVRYYLNGRYINDSNYVSKHSFYAEFE